MLYPTPEEKAAREIAEYIEDAWLQVSHLTSKGRLAFIEVTASRFILAVVADQKKEDARKAEDFSDFGPSTRCPDCGSSGQVLHWYTLGRKDAALAIQGRTNA